jgi:hypothetical protein
VSDTLKNENLIRVSVVPPTPAVNRNALFESRRLDSGSHSPNTHWLDYFAAVRDRGKQINVLFDTSDMIAPDETDVLIYMVQPDSPQDVLDNRKRYPWQKIVLLMCETSIGCRYLSNPQNHLVYDAVITYIDTLADRDRYFFFPPRAYYRDRIANGLPFPQRKVGCLVGTNRKMTYRTGLMVMKKGWKFSPSDWFDYVLCPGELVSFRSEVGKMCALYRDRGFDLYGEGWELLRETRDVCKGVPRLSVLDYIGNYRYYFALENHSGPCSLISERIWDALWGDAVPVYRGNTKLSNFVPAECYIDGTRFRNAREMFEYLCSVPEREWEQFHRAGREFIHGDGVARFLPDAFAERFLGYIRTIASPKLPFSYAGSHSQL